MSQVCAVCLIALVTLSACTTPAPVATRNFSPLSLTASGDYGQDPIGVYR